jgi:hypothetical protein
MNLIDIATFSRKHFFFFINKCNEFYRSGHDLRLYRKIIDIHRKCDNLEDLLEDRPFLTTLYDTLEKWNMNQRGAQLAPFDDFIRSIKFWKDYIVKLYQYKMYKNMENNIVQIEEILMKIFCNIKVMQSRRRIVGVSKALHFLLPDLVMPIDGKFTIPAIFGYNKYAQTTEKEFIIFRQIFREFFGITDRLK